MTSFYYVLICIYVLLSYISYHDAHVVSLKASNRMWMTLSSVNSINNVAISRKNVGLFNEYGRDLSGNAKELVKPEILAPAGGWNQLKAAVANGADAVYFGLQEGFNARARASNFPLEELPDVMKYLHERNKKGYLVVNILVFDEELEKLENIVKKIAVAGVDALIMQDIGAVDLVKSIAPSLNVHGSTQMSITDANGAIFAKKTLGIDRIVIGRELTINEISSVVRDNQNVEVEAFVHGAMCVSYSGQCFSSEAWGGRSANRGQCSQACRMPYGMIVNGTLVDLVDDIQYLLSPQDLCGIDYVPQLIMAGVRSFKIEGRLKGPEYVAITTKAYREAVDEAWDLFQASATHDVAKTLYKGPSTLTRNDLKQTFSRGQDETFDGLSAGFLNGVKHQSLVRGNSPKSRGLYIGKVVKSSKSTGVTIELGTTGSLSVGDGIVFDRRMPELNEEGGIVYKIHSNTSPPKEIPKGVPVTSGKVSVTFDRNSVDYTKVSVGNLVWKTKDDEVDRRLKAYNDADGKQNVVVRVDGSIGNPLKISVETVNRDVSQLIAVAYTKSILQEAKASPLDTDSISSGIGSLGNSPFKIEDFIVAESLLIGNLFVSMSDIKAARREAVEALLLQTHDHDVDDGVKESSVLPSMRETAKTVASLPPSPIPTTPALSVLCRTAKQVTAACKLPYVAEIFVDFLEVHGLRESVNEVKRANKKVTVCTPRIIKPEEDRLFYFYLRLRPDALLVRSAGFLNQLLDMGGTGAFVTQANCTIPELYGDSYLNTANALTAKLFLETGLSRLSPSLDLNAKQISGLAKHLSTTTAATATTATSHIPIGASRIECILHMHLPIFHTEHCVFCRFLSTGNSYKDCGHPCENNSVSLRDMGGEDHLVLADQGCRNTVFNAKAQSGISYVRQFVDAGIKHYRVELVDEEYEYVEPLLRRYHHILNNVDDRDAYDELASFLNSVPNAHGKVAGHTAGSYEVKQEIQWKNMKKTSRR